MSKIEELAKLLSRFPGIGKKTAQRLVFFLLKEKQEYCAQLGMAIQEIKKFIKPCSICGYFTDQDPCEICTNINRDVRHLCVVATTQDIIAFEESDVFQGVYHVLGGLLSPIDGVGPNDLSLSQLKARIAKQDEVRGGYVVQEVILATPPTLEGESTARYIKTYVQRDGLLYTRIALGMPVGGDFEYVDKGTLSHSMFARREME